MRGIAEDAIFYLVGNVTTQRPKMILLANIDCLSRLYWTHVTCCVYGCKS